MCICISIYIYLYVCLCVCVCVYIYIYIHTYVYIACCRVYQRMGEEAEDNEDAGGVKNVRMRQMAGT